MDFAHISFALSEAYVLVFETAFTASVCILTHKNTASACVFIVCVCLQ